MPVNLEEDFEAIPEERRAFVEFLQARYIEFCEVHLKRTRTRRPPSEADFARYLNTSGANYSRWINGKEIPSYKLAYRISKKLGMEVYDLLGYEKPQININNKRLAFLNEHFEDLPDEDQEEMYLHAKEIVDKKYGRGQRKDNGGKPGG